MPSRHESVRTLGGGSTASGLSFRAALIVATLSAITGGSGMKADTNSDSVAALRQLIEQQDRKLDELNEKVRRLEEREQQRDTAPADQHLPAVVIDTNGVPIATGAANPPEMESAGARTKGLEARLSAGEGGFCCTSADTNFELTLRGVVQVDTQTFFNSNPYLQGNDGFLLRRARPIVEAKLFHDFDLVLAPDFGWPASQIFDAYVNYKYRPALQFRAGKFKGPVGLESLQTDTAVSFNEKSLASDLVPMRNLGFQLGGELDEGVLDWVAGVYNADGDYRVTGNNSFNNDLEFGGRLFLQPFKNANSDLLQGLGLGVGGSYGIAISNNAALPNTLGGTLPGYVTAGQEQFFAYNPLYGSVVADGDHWRLSPEACYYLGPFGVQGEYDISDQSVLNNLTLTRAALNNTAWQISGQWVLTGEKASFTGLTPAQPFAPRAGRWGALQLVARLSGLRIDKAAFNGFSDPTTSARSAAAWSVGLNWWLNRNVRVLTSFSHTTFQGGGEVNPYIPSTTTPPATITHQDENIVFSRIQVAF
jgi:phosphate-selective porin OprO/OprP